MPLATARFNAQVPASYKHGGNMQKGDPRDSWLIDGDWMRAFHRSTITLPVE